ncbi:MAG: MamK family actin-like protein [Planctomycetota bacterium]|nr:MamK family actin-like protein [Planctomycetota bacterium]
MSQSPSEESSTTPPATPVSPSAGVLYVGIDLGTSRTSVAASNGVRVTLASYVGYPKDVVSKKLLQRDVLYGDDAIEHRLSLDLYRPLEHGVLKVSEEGSAEDAGNLRAARDLLIEAIHRARPRKDELVYAVIGAPAQASITSKNAIVGIARDCVDSVMLCSEPFAVAYGQDMLDDVLVIDIGAGTVDLCRMHGTMPEDTDQITLETAGDFVDGKLAELVRENHPGAQFSDRMLKDIKERHSSVAEVMQPVLVTLPVAGKPTEFDMTAEIQAASRAIVPPIVDGLGKLVGSFDPEFQERLKGRVLLAGGGSQIKGLDLAIEREMVERLGGGKVSRIEEPLYGGANGALKIAHDMPEEFWEKLK